MLPREAWLDLARKLDWTFRYVPEADLFPGAPSGETRVAPEDWRRWEEPFKTSYRVRRARRGAEAVRRRVLRRDLRARGGGGGRAALGGGPRFARARLRMALRVERRLARGRG